MIPNIQAMNAIDILKWLISYGEGYTRNKRSCSEYEDNTLFLTNVIRTMQKNVSGREFIQAIEDDSMCYLSKIGRCSYFDALKSNRRLSYVKDISSAVLILLERFIGEEAGVDYLSKMPELDGRYVIAADGHSIEHSVHDKKINGKYSCMTTIYGQNLRNGLIDPIDMVIDPNSSKPNEIKFLKKSLPEYGANRVFTKPIIIYDRASIDHQFWTIKNHQWTIVTRLKSNVKPIFKELIEYDRDDIKNEGVTGHYIIGLNNAGSMYQIDYKDPETGTEYSFLTNDRTLSPGAVAYLYRIRWKIEKTFDVFKNKLFEKKAWATSETAKEMQVHFIAFTYNFILFIEQLVKDEAVDNKIDIEFKVKKKREKALKTRQKKAVSESNSVPKCEYNIQYIYQITQQFIRCLRSWIIARTTLKSCFNLFIQRLTHYI